MIQKKRITTRVKIRITENLTELFEDFKPRRGATYYAERHVGLNKVPGYVIVVNGHRVAIRASECEEVAEE